jgi:hypothetical protein
VQQEPATSLDPELMGPLAAIGIIKGKSFAPDARMKKILTDALALVRMEGTAKTYKVTLPKGIPAEKFWSLTVYDDQTLSVTCGRSERRRVSDGLLQSHSADGCPTRQLDSDHAR